MTNNSNVVYKTIINEGAILISNNGSLTNPNGYIGNMTDGTYAAVYVSGTNASWANIEGIHVGNLGYGRLDVTLGGTVTSNEAIIGELADAYGDATVSGTNSTWNTNTLFVGNTGYGILNINNGGAVTSYSRSTVGEEIGSTGVVTVTGADSTFNTNFFRLGYEGYGTLNIKDGGTVLSDNVYAANWGGSSGIANITGANSTWEITGTLNLSRGGWNLYTGWDAGTSGLSIANGGIVSSTNGTMSLEDVNFAPSTVTVTGSNSAWNNSDTLTVGYGDDFGDITTSPATIRIGSGGTVSAGNQINLNSTGDINLLGGTLRTAKIEFAQGKGLNFDKGTLHLTQSTTINTSNIYDLDVKQLFSGQTLRVDGTITLQTSLTLNGGKLSTGSIVGFNHLDFQSGYFELTQGNFTIGSTGLAGPNVNLSTGKHMNITNNASIAGNGVLNLSGGSFAATKLTNNGTIIASGNTTSFFGTGDPGKELVHNGLEIRITAGSKLVLYAPVSGSGDFTGPGDVYFTTDYSPGTSTGIVNFEGNVEFLGYGPNGEDDGYLNLELAGLLSGEFDQLVIAGNVSLAGNLTVDLLDGFLLSPDNQFEILDIAGTLSGQFVGLSEGDLVGNYGGEDLFISYTAGDGNDIVLFTDGITGDYDSDNDVDGYDFLKWQRSFGDTYDGENLVEWEANFGSIISLAVGSVTTAVPEPNIVLLGVMACLMGISFRHH